MRLGHFDLNLFVTLDALLETRSITQASQRLHIGASATSSALGRLREHFEDELLVQVGRRMELTPLAVSLQTPVRDLILRSQATLASKAAFDPSCEKRHFIFNASDYATSVLLEPLSRALEREAPGITIDVVGLSDRNLQRLERGDVDFAIYPERNASDAHPREDLLTETHCCAVWTGHESIGDTLSFEDYMAARHVAAHFGEKRIASFESWFLSAHGVARQVVLTASTFNELPFLLIGTQRIATLHSRLAQRYAKILPVRVLPLPFEMPPLKLVVQWNRHNERDAAHSWLRRRLQQVAAALD